MRLVCFFGTFPSDPLSLLLLEKRSLEPLEKISLANIVEENSGIGIGSDALTESVEGLKLEPSEVAGFLPEPASPTELTGLTFAAVERVCFDCSPETVAEPDHETNLFFKKNA